MTFESEGLLIVAIYIWLPPASYVVFSVLSSLTTLVMPPAWEVRRGHLVIGSSICLSVRNSTPLTNQVQHLKSLGNDTVTKLEL